MSFNNNTDKRIRIIYMVSTLARKGPIVQLYNLVKYLDRNCFEPLILTISPESSDSLLPRFRELKVPFYSLGLSRLDGVFLGTARLTHFLYHHPVDVIQSFEIRADTLMSRCGVKGVTWISRRSETFKESKIIEFGIILGNIIDSIHMWALRKVDRIVCVSNYVYQTAPKGLQQYMDVIQNGVDQDAISPVSASEREVLRRRLGFGEDRIIFISVGCLSRRKDPITLLQGFLASSVGERAMLVFLGDGPLRGECEALIAGRSNVRIIGHVNNVNQYIQAADVFVSGSLSEGLPNVVLESLACGVPVVLSDIGPHREILELDSIAGKLFPIKDVSALARTLEETMNSNYESMRKGALNIIRNHLNASIMAAQYQALYLKYCKERDNSQ